jgi:predicted amidohydrolase
MPASLNDVVRKTLRPNMTKIVRIATTSIATLEDFAPPYNLSHPDPKVTFARGLALIDAAAATGAHLVCLPETFMAAGLPASRIPELAEPIDGASFQALSERARRHGIHVVAGMFVRSGVRVENHAVLIDGNGHLVGSYAKKHPTEGEIDGGITPGSRAAVFQTSIGRIGLAICFDLNWADLWQEMANQGAEIVCWISAYEGGFPLQAYAWLHRLTVVSSVQSYQAKIIDRTGRILTETSRWGRMTTWDIDLHKGWFHTDGQGEQIVAVQTRYGSRVRVETLGQEHMFSIECRDPTLDIAEIVEVLQLVSYEDYIARCTSAQGRGRTQPPLNPQISEAAPS